MTDYDLDVLDTIGTSDYVVGELSDNGLYITSLLMSYSSLMRRIEVDIPLHLIPPNPDDSDGA